MRKVLVGFLTAAVLTCGLSVTVLRGQTSCNPQLSSPAICIPAHAEPPSQQPSGGDCEFDMMHNCVPTPNSLCFDRYATAIPGTCQLSLDYTRPTDCIANNGVTVVELAKYTAACRNDNGNCICVFTQDTSANPVQVQVCECLERPL